MALLTLFGNLDSGNVHKVAMILARAELPYRRIEVSQTRGEPRRPEFLQLNPIGKVPAVMLEDGDVLSESGAMLYYFAQETPLWPDELRRRTEVLRWMFFEQYSHEPSLAVIRYLRNYSDDPAAHEEEARALEPRAHNALAAMEQRLGQAPFIADGRCTIADYALYPYTAWAGEAGIDLNGYPEVLAWLGRVEDQPGFLPLRHDAAVEVVSFEDWFGKAA